MSSSVEQSPTKTTAPATTTSTASTSSSTGTSNSEAQAAAGLSGEVPPTSSEGDLLATLPTLGAVGTVVLDAMPLAAALPVALQLMSIDWVAEWVGALAPGEVADAGPSAVKGVLDALFPVGMGVEVNLDVELSLPVASLEPGALVAVKRQSEGWLCTATGKVAASLGIDADDTVSVGGAGDNQAGCGASATGEGAVEVELSTILGDETFLAELARLGVLSITTLLGGFGSFAVLLFTDNAGRMVASGELGGGAEAWAGTSAVGVSTDGTLGEAKLDIVDALGKTGAAAGFTGSLEGGGGVDQGRVYGFAEGGYAVTAGGSEAIEGKGTTESRLRVEAWADPAAEGASPEILDQVNEVRVTYIDGTDADAAERSLAGTRWTDVDDLIKGGANCDDAGEVIGDLRISREHRVDDPELLAPYLPEGVLPQSAELDVLIFEAKIEFRDTVEVLVTETDARAAAPAGADADAVRDVQRSMAAHRLGEVFETPGFEPSDDDQVAVEEARIDVRSSAEGGVSPSGIGGDLGIAITREIDLQAEAQENVELARELLSA